MNSMSLNIWVFQTIPLMGFKTKLTSTLFFPLRYQICSLVDFFPCQHLLWICFFIFISIIHNGNLVFIYYSYPSGMKQVFFFLLSLPSPRTPQVLGEWRERTKYKFCSYWFVNRALLTGFILSTFCFYNFRGSLTLCGKIKSPVMNNNHKYNKPKVRIIIKAAFPLI